MKSRISVNGTLYEKVSKGSNKRVREHHGNLKESAYDGDFWKGLSNAEKEEFRDSLVGYLGDVANDYIEEDFQSAENFVKSVHMTIPYHRDNSYEFDCTVAVDEEWWLDWAEMPDAESDGYYVAEGLMELWKKSGKKVEKAVNRLARAYDDNDATWIDDEIPEVKDASEDLIDLLEDIAVDIASQIKDDINSQLDYLHSDEFIVDEIESGNIDDVIDDWLLDHEDSDYADNESVTLARESFTKDIGIAEYSYPELDDTQEPDFGPGYEYSSDDERLTVYLVSPMGSGDVTMVTLSMLDDEFDTFEYAYTRTGYEGESGYKRAVKDFRRICRELDHGTDPEDVARRFHMSKESL